MGDRMSQKQKLIVNHSPYTEVITCRWEHRYNIVNKLLNSPFHEARKEYSAKEVIIEPAACEITGRLNEAKITVVYQYSGNTWTWVPEAQSIEAN